MLTPCFYIIYLSLSDFGRRHRSEDTRSTQGRREQAQDTSEGGAHPEPESYQFSSQASSEDTTNPEENWEQTQHISDEGGQPSFRS